MPAGDYIILASDSPNFDLGRKAVAFGYFSVSTIGFIQRNTTSQGLEFIVVDRKTGQPLSGVEMQSWFQVYNNKTYRYDIKKGERYTADQNGHMLIPANARFGDTIISIVSSSMIKTICLPTGQCRHTPMIITNSSRC
ncbi:MAG: hypothetical protein MZV63_15205 [Marinilabiliales bacterium]|nr:hypothetical protein [Marinilabiliales bacterium]